MITLDNTTTMYTVRRLDKDRKPVIDEVQTVDPELFQACFPYPIYTSKEVALAVWGNRTLDQFPWKCVITYTDGTEDKYLTAEDPESAVGVTVKSSNVVRITTFGEFPEVIIIPLPNIKFMRISQLRLEVEDSSTPTV